MALSDNSLKKRTHLRVSKIWMQIQILLMTFILAACGGGGNVEPKLADLTPRLARPACGINSPLTLWTINASQVNKQQLDTMICTFYEVYPKMEQLLKTNGPKEVTFDFDDAYNLPPAWVAGGATVHYSTKYLARNVLDTDVAVHELTHLIQSKQTSVPAGWIIEGTADWIRNLLGLHNAANGWYLPTSVKSTESYRDGYGTAARFFNWIDSNYRQGKDPVAVALQVNALNGITYSPGVWTELTGRSLAQLWSEYSGQPLVVPATTGISVYFKQNLEGFEVKLERGRYDNTDLDKLDIANDTIRSIGVPQGYKITVFQHEHFTGASQTFNSDVKVLDMVMDKAISSLVIE